MKISFIKNLFAGAGVFFLAPSIALAQGTPQIQQGITSLGGLVNTFTSTVVKAVGTLFLALAVVAFFWGIVQYIWAKRGGDAAKMKVGGEFMVWGLIALFVMFSVYGIIRFAQKTLQVEGTEINIPTINIGGSGSQVNPPTGGTVPTGGQVTPPTGGTVNPFGGVGTQTIEGCPFGYVRDSTVTEGDVPGCRRSTEGSGDTVRQINADGSCPAGSVPDDESSTGCSAQ